MLQFAAKLLCVTSFLLLCDHPPVVGECTPEGVDWRRPESVDGRTTYTHTKCSLPTHPPAGCKRRAANALVRAMPQDGADPAWCHRATAVSAKLPFFAVGYRPLFYRVRFSFLYHSPTVIFYAPNGSLFILSMDERDKTHLSLYIIYIYFDMYVYICF